MTDLESIPPALNGGEDQIIDDGEEAESKVQPLTASAVAKAHAFHF
jgi:hypothetical protein